MNSWKSFNYFIGVIPRTIETAHPVLLFPGRFKNGLFKNREDDTRSLSQNLGLLGAGGSLPTVHTDFRRRYRDI
jgi:predicted component of type VI protein secretion system